MRKGAANPNLSGEMNRIKGAIVPAGSKSRVDRESWCRLIVERRELQLFSPLEAINPFTREPTVIRPGADAVRIVVGGVELGTASWTMAEDHPLVNVSFDRSAIVFVESLAAELGGKLEVYPQIDPCE